MAEKTTQKPDTWNMVLKRGDVWPKESILLKDENGSPITGFYVVCTIKRSISDTAAVKTLVDGDGFIVSDNLITFDAVVDLPIGTYWYDIQVTLSNGDVHTKYQGYIRVVIDITI